MPQKRNPDLFELVRGRSATALAALVEALAITAKLPSGYHRDLQLLKAPLFRAARPRPRHLRRSSPPPLPRVRFGATVERPAPELFAAERAHRLVLDEGIPFREAYRVAAELRERAPRRVTGREGDRLGSDHRADDHRRIVNRQSGVVYQLTSGTTSLHGIAFDSFAARVASGRSENPLGSNPELNDEVFLLDRVSGVFSQVTRTMAGLNQPLDLDASGSTLVFVSDSEEYVGPPPPGGHYLFRMRLEDGSFERVQDWAWFYIFGTKLSGDGTRLAASLDGFLYLWDFSSHDWRVAVEPEGTTFFNAVEDISTDGSRIFFRSFADRTGGNPDYSIEVFRADCPRDIFSDGFESGTTGAWSSQLP